ncbi:lipid-A-disaccharide synthase [Rhizobium sp. SSA_523]|uniref:lipid-A-disaccharide synthase n=1 Tax=Rhizobium sp. SSA_523 TaxID=2952477 RepID=UPI0020906081|nr:lipid-A-disaccharide synthase [Rhizobium sp. SSA_523]MCO5733911.1 lipid-A-disaccharide synthase [Rhizobium sp. SSA_523]WKC24825.1 lipid-A-disaccharide synthase [Rhizobium sp. SSA_523]
MSQKPLKIAVVAGEVSGDLLGGDLIRALKAAHPAEITLVGVGGEALEAEGLTSLFDFSELSIMGVSEVLKRLPKLLRRIRETADAIIAARPDLLLIIDSPDFTHRVAKRVREALPDLPVVDYVCPSVWAWKEYRAPAMLAYVDQVLALLPFEPEAMRRLGGPKTDFVGHRLTADENVLAVRRLRQDKQPGREAKTVLLLPGSRSTEIRMLLPALKETVEILAARNPAMEFLLPTVARQRPLLEKMLADWSIQPKLTSTPAEKWAGFAAADSAIAASGTVTLELALCGVPTVSIYKADWLVRLMAHRIKIWSAALPNLIADQPVIPEHVNDLVRPGYLARWAECLSSDTPQRRAMLEGFSTVWERLSTGIAPGEAGARLVLELLSDRAARDLA